MSDLTVVPLRDLCGYRSGDKGDLINVALFAYSPEVYELIRREVTAARVADHMAPLVRGDVHRYEVPNVLALNFVMHEALGGGATNTFSTTRSIRWFHESWFFSESEISSTARPSV